MKRFKIEYGFLGINNPYYSNYIVCEADSLQDTAKYIVLGRLRTLDRTYCDAYDENHHCERLWINR